ncbi:hypothetical protein DRO24_01300 [Candidatus Bathyarchaeota archaeon]|nr:MAG: hypothetical protein DRO24_01300 [Candidatus Bathyarchaeota archaeon]
MGRSLSGDVEGYLERSARGVFILLIGKVLSTAFSALAVILIARLIGSRAYGHVSMAMIPVSIAILFSDPGVSAGLTRHIAYYTAARRRGDVPPLLKAGLSLNLLLSLLLAFLIYSLSSPLSALFHEPAIEALIRLASLYIVVNTLLSTSQAIFTGFERMELYTLISVVYSILRCIFSILLILIGLGALGAIAGNVLAMAVSALLAFLLIIPYLRFPSNSSLDVSAATSLLLSYGSPLFVSNLLTVGLNQLYSFLLASNVEAYVMGNYQAAVNFSALLGLLTVPITTALFPLFSKLDGGMLREAFQVSVKYTAFLLIPATLLLVAVSREVVWIVYGGSYRLASRYLALYLLNFLFIGLGGLSVANLLNGQGETKVVLHMRLLNLLLGLPLAFILIPRFGVVGLIATLIVSPRLGLFYGLYWIWRNYGFTVDFPSSGKIYLSAGIALLVVWPLLLSLHLSPWLSLLLGASLYILLYLLLTVLLRLLDERDLRNLRRMVEALGPLSTFLNPLLSLLETLLERLTPR